MSEEKGALAQVADALKARGFRYECCSSTGIYMFCGVLRTSIGNYDCKLFIDPNFSSPPLVYLLQIPIELKPVAPHISSDGNLCYLSKSTVALDIFDPVGQVLACLKQAENVLEKILKKELVDDLEEEFFAYWGTMDFPCYSDVQNPEAEHLQGMITPIGLPVIAFVTDNKNRTKKKIELLGLHANRMTCPVVRIRTKAKPRPNLIDWPPNTLKKILDWQSMLENRCRTKIEHRVSQAAESGATAVVVMIDSPAFTYCFSVFFNGPNNEKHTPKQLRSKTILYKSYVLPMSICRIDETYMSQRNIPGQTTLEGKRIALIGCGTIGGYLADMLVKAGAGISGGRLFLVDNDTLQPANLGRHRLGFQHLGKNKATAMADELSRDAPGADVKSLPVNIQTANLATIDLLIDATGEEALGDWLVTKYGSVPQLSVWIEGPGIAVRGLLRASIDNACFRCLVQYNRDGLFRSTTEKLPIIYSGQGCEQLYVPFPASAAIHAACLGAEMVLDWVNRKTSPALRTRIVNEDFKLATVNCDLSRLKECPACHR